LFEHNEIDFEAFRRQKTAIYIKLSEDQADYFQFLIDVFYAKFFAAMMKGSPDPSKLDVYCYLDEFGSSYVDNFSMIINNIRKYRVSLSLVFQGISQIEEKYGDKKAKSITTGILTSIIYGGADPITAKLFSDKIGTKVIQQKRKHEDADINYASTPLLAPEAIRTIPAGKALLVSSNQPALIFDFKQYFKSGSPFKRAVKKGAYKQPIRPQPPKKEPFTI
jgi:type IV secretory pathway TraG/TraD family ATPase VirD4